MKIFSAFPLICAFLTLLLAFTSCQPAPDESAETETAPAVEQVDEKADPPAPDEAKTASEESGESVPKAAASVETPEETMKKNEQEAGTGAVAAAAADANIEVATLGGGCFWCTEAVMERIDGVIKVVSGYMGGHVENPTYEQVITKTTGHAEVIQVTFDSSVITFEELLDIFWQAHDPTTLNQQGNDRGPQYRSAIFYHSPEQKNIAEQSKAELDASGAYPDPAVTEITEASTFWVAEDYHQGYFRENKDTNPYCRVVILPKLQKLGLD